ncbi:hypothetical protein G7Y89_g14687 [Cudoniella acicularis]|uniref:Uncharacterized protein n=1 Tax=Cudoniella acicularis TaxID=354080 RepID=A0A8H4R0R3_9HELO|nr:hypothetical protein G7Y89_g14687 [Cudoniella acicularis]
MASSSASSPTSSAELLALASSGQENFMPAAEEAQQDLPHKFLSLAPTVSASYPSSPKPRSSIATPLSPSAQTPDNNQVEPTAAIPEPKVLDSDLSKSRRSSSMSSEGSNAGLNQRRRFLRLGPVHYGEDRDGKGDWSEEVIVE